MRSIGASASKGSQAAPAFVTAIWAIRSSAPRHIHRPTTSPGPMPRRDKAARHRVGAGIDLGIAVTLGAEDQRGMVRPGARARDEKIRQDLVAKEIVARFAPQDRGLLGGLDPETRALGRPVHPTLRPAGLMAGLAAVRTHGSLRNLPRSLFMASPVPPFPELRRPNGTCTRARAARVTRFLACRVRA